LDNFEEELVKHENNIGDDHVDHAILVIEKEKIGKLITYLRIIT